MLQMRLVTIPFRSPFRLRAASPLPAAAIWHFLGLVADATNVFSDLCYHFNVEKLNKTKRRAPLLHENGTFPTTEEPSALRFRSATRILGHSKETEFR